MEKWVAVGQREVSPFQTLGSVAGYAIEKAGAAEEGSTLEVLTAMLTAPMMVEALLNHVAMDLFLRRRRSRALWEVVERSNPEQKLNAVCEAISYEPDFSRPPFQHFRQMFRFRNLIAHGKTETIKGQVVHDGSERFSLHRAREFMPEWERKCTLANARHYYKAARQIAQILCEASGVAYPIDHGTWTGSPLTGERTTTKDD